MQSACNRRFRKKARRPTRFSLLPNNSKRRFRGRRFLFTSPPCDTVSSVGWKTNPLKLPYTTDNPDIDIARHAVSIDERRAFFRNHLWRPKPPNGGPRQLKQ